MTSESAGAVGKTGHIAANCTKGSWNKSLNAVEEDKGDISEEVHEDPDELHAWCLLQERERAVARSHSHKSKLKQAEGVEHCHESLLEC